jgi:parallel beta-helix repeat protein
MRKGVYVGPGNDVINTSDLGTDTGLTITGGYNGVGNPGAFVGTTTLEPPNLAGGNGIIEFSSNNAITVRRLKVDSASVAPPYAVGQAPVFNAGGTNDTLGALPAAFRVTVLGGAPTNAVDLTGGSTTITNVRVKPQYTGDGVLCFGSASCALSHSTVTGTAGTTGVLVQGAAGTTVGPNNVISNNTAGGVLLQAATGATVDNNTITSNAGGAVVGTSNFNQSSNDTVSGNTIGGTTSAGVELETTGGYTITSNTVTGLGSGGEGFILVGSDGDTVSANTVTGSAAGVLVTGNDLTGPSTGNTVSNNNFSSNLLAGAAADGFGSPESWNKPGTGNQGIQGTVFLQSQTAVPSGGPITTTCPDAALATCVLAVSPTGFSPAVPGAYEAVAGYLADAGFICNSGSPADGGVPVDQEGYTVIAGPTYLPNVVACTDGAGNIYLATPYFGSGATVTVAIAQGNGDATGPSTTSEPGCESSPPPNTGQPSCTGTMLTLSDLPFYNTVADGNAFSTNMWSNETIAGAIDGSGPYGQFTNSTLTYVDGNPDNPPGLQNTWTGNTGDPSFSPCDPTNTAPACAA